MGDKNMSTALVYAFDNVKLTFENEAVLQSNVLTGETRTLVFVIGAGTLTMVATANNGTINVTNNTGISQRVVWEYPSSVEVVVHQIDEKFIPETIARTADIVATPPSATVGQTIMVKSVDDTGKPTAWEAVDMAESVDIPETLPNPNKLTFTGAVTAEYDGSSPVTVEIPEGGGGTSGGESAKLRNIGTFNLSENVNTWTISADSDGNAFSAKEMWVWLDMCFYCDTSASNNGNFNLKLGDGTHTVSMLLSTTQAIRKVSGADVSALNPDNGSCTLHIFIRNGRVICEAYGGGSSTNFYDCMYNQVSNKGVAYAGDSFTSFSISGAVSTNGIMKTASATITILED